MSMAKIAHVFFNVLFLVNQINANTCYGVYGCFDDPGTPEAPQSPEKMKVRFQLSTRDIRTHVSCYGLDIEILPNKTNIGEFMNLNLPTKVIIPGWLQGGGVEWVKELIKALLSIEDSNVIFVNWRYGSLLVNYPQSKWNTKLLGRMIGEFFNRLNNDFDYNLNNVHIYGHSLGAHAAGIAGAWTNGELGTITGLDPAGPLFHRAPPSERLDPTDAKFVLVLHTDSGHYYETHLGISRSCGHVDLYPNGGYNQPGCEMDHRMLNLANIYPNLNQVVDSIFACSHQRAIDLLLESLTNHLCKFVAYKCSTYEDFEKDMCSKCEDDQSNCIVFGRQYYSERQPQQGSYFFKTDGTPLYCQTEFNYQPVVPEEPLPLATTEAPAASIKPSTELELEPERGSDDENASDEESEPEAESESNAGSEDQPEQEAQPEEEIETEIEKIKIEKPRQNRKSSRWLRPSKNMVRDEFEMDDDVKGKGIRVPAAPYWSRAPPRSPFAYPYPPYPMMFDK